MVTTKKDKGLSVLIKDLDLVFGEYIKLRDTKNGVINCFICGHPVKRNEAEVMHFIPRAKMPTRYNEQNCHAGDVACNKFDDEHTTRYGRKIDEAYGEGTAIGLDQMSFGLMKFTRSDLNEMLADFKERIKILKK